jgi:hypothetical protein
VSDISRTNAKISLGALPTTSPELIMQIDREKENPKYIFLFARHRMTGYDAVT